MINFVNGSAHHTFDNHGLYTQYAGMLGSPLSANNVLIAAQLGMPWALDNGCFKEYDPDGIKRMLIRYQGVDGCKFAVLPDVVCDHAGTRLLASAWIGTYQLMGYPIAFVLQNGVTPDSVPWDSISAVFIGGDTAFKYSDTVRMLVDDAKQLEKWVHMGRVNSNRRIKYAQSIGCDSFDGSGFSIAPRSKIKTCLSSYISPRQMNLWELKETRKP